MVLTEFNLYTDNENFGNKMSKFQKFSGEIYEIGIIFKQNKSNSDFPPFRHVVNYYVYTKHFTTYAGAPSLSPRSVFMRLR